MRGETDVVRKAMLVDHLGLQHAMPKPMLDLMHKTLHRYPYTLSTDNNPDRKLRNIGISAYCIHINVNRQALHLCRSPNPKKKNAGNPRV